MTNLHFLPRIGFTQLLCSALLASVSMTATAQQYGNPYIKQRVMDQPRAIKSQPAQRTYHLNQSVNNRIYYQDNYYQDHSHRQQVADYYRWLAERDYYDRHYRDRYHPRYDDRYYERDARRYHDRYPNGGSVNISINIPLEETVRRHYHTSTYINADISTDRSKAWFIYSTRNLPLMGHFSDRQRRIHYDSFERAMRSAVGERITWNSRFASGSVQAIDDGYNRDGDYCRQFKQVVHHKKQRQNTLTTACQRPNGHWKVVASQ